MNIQWVKCQGDDWCRLMGVKLPSVTTDTGVYLIWMYSGGTPIVIRVGQGNIQDRLSKHRRDTDITDYGEINHATLYVTWAILPAAQIGGVEAWLGDQLQPLVGETFPEDPPIPVTLPGW